jgi:hypothetical protein
LIVQPTITLEEYTKQSQSLGVFPSETRDRYGYYETEQHTISDFLCALYNANLLQSENNMIDVGSGLGTTLYNFYIQSRESKLKNLFKIKLHGVEADVELAMKFEKNLLPFFNGELMFCVAEAEELDYSQYNFVYMYSPMKLEGMHRLYNKILQEISPGTVVYDNYMFGEGIEKILEEKSTKFNLFKRTLVFGNIQHTVWVKS